MVAKWKQKNRMVWIINQAKSKLASISKAVFDTANKNIPEATSLNQCANTDTVIYWFKGIRNKHLWKFVVFEVKRILSFHHRKPA